MTSEEGTLSADGVTNLETTGEQGVLSLIKIDRNKILGAGNYGIVFEGTWKEKTVAVKRVQIANTESSKLEVEALQKLDHPSVIKLFHVQSDEDFRYYALELCQASLNYLFLKDGDKNKYRGPMPSDKEVLLQLATGLAHIHEKELIHRDLKPQNVLIYVDCSNGEKVQLKWADFGLSKPVNENGSCSMSGINRGTDSWYAPEILKITAEHDEGKLEKKKEKKEKKEKKDKGTENSEEKDAAKKEKKEKKEKKKDKKEEKSEGVTDVEVTSPRMRSTVKSDVFGEGLIFGYYLLGGDHPYGSKSNEITSNILNDKLVNLKEMKKQQPIIHDIIMEMLKNNPAERISSSEVVSRITNI